jgi:uncharacterized protein
MSSSIDDRSSQAEYGVTNEPFSQFVLKMSGRCDLACDYCYVYTMADQRWRGQPALMSPEVVRRTAGRIGEHAARYDLERVSVILHGGEPLLAGPAGLAAAVDAVRDAVPASCATTFVLQTNGVLLDTRTLDALAERGVEVCVSLDGDAAAQDRHRRYRDGRGSHAAVQRGLELLTGPRYRHLFNGLLCTVDLRNDALETYEALCSYGPPGIDFLLPHGNWSDAPPGRIPGSGDTPYAHWLIRIFDAWYDGAGDGVRIRMFTEIIHCLLGGQSTVDGIGRGPAGYVVVGTDGGIECGDTVNASVEGASSTGATVETHAFHQVRSMAVALHTLSDTCRSCELVEVCGGGLPAHRYRAGEGFGHPSVYCPDLYALIDHIRRAVARDVERLIGPGP